MTADLVRNPNDMTDRDAMGLPKGFVDGLPADLFTANADLVGAAPAALVDLAHDREVPLPRRVAAATILGLVGDPRISTFEPLMIDIPGGRVRLGLPPERVSAVVDTWGRVGVRAEWIEKECPDHETYVAAFRLARFPVTNQDYREFLVDTGARWLPTSWRFGTYPHHHANHPVWTVPPAAADAYAAWLAQRTGRAFRLPTEAEWEYAAAGYDGREFPWGDDFDPARLNTIEGGVLDTTPVGVFPHGRSPFGVDDMGGNVEEYVADLYRPYPGGHVVRDDLTTAAPQYRVARGGSFTRYGDLARTRRRHGWFERPIYAIGFRLAC
ncbi:formylglycine-generating enzyme family protein [Nonomuraea guangzhouensis]|uniref:Formylglycine-generating enzyme family protein n=1 Tax=Nonomuraea guangzhouensis TaxID=1291555 RepID=A0ABW4GT68_9ACTN|nr:SUMF1/EgtB/PvdO family nonheme iron enzyme [Nonomuraea guangzhouensis]